MPLHEKKKHGSKDPPLRLGFGGFGFFLGLFLLFLFLEFVADDFEDGHLGVVADTIAGVDDAGAAAESAEKTALGLGLGPAG